jgi:putative ABC transport system permease protein
MEFEGLNIGDEVPIRNSLWKVVGVFESGDQHESEILTDSETMMSAYQRNWFNAVTVQLESPDAFAKFKEAITTNPTLTVDVKRESEFFAEQSKPLGNVLRLVAYFIGGIMAVGALFGALNTMYTAVSARTIEIATLRALGFGPVPVVISVFVEALLLALMGGAIGCVLAWLFFDGNVVSTSAGGINQIVFALSVTPAMVAVGLTWACVIGLFGGLFPAIRVARLPVATALRAT